MKTQIQKGFTLIELLIVIVLIGILSAFGVGKYANLSTTANVAAGKSAAGQLTAASAINHAICLANSADDACLTTTDCASINTVLMDIPFDTVQFTIAGIAPACTISSNGATAAAFKGFVDTAT